MSIVAFRSSSAANNGIGTGGTLAITKPSGLAIGDLMLAHIVTINADTNASVSVSITGWTSLYSSGAVAGAGYNFSVLWKIADSADVAASSFSVVPSPTSINVYSYGRISCFSGADDLMPINVSSNNIGTATASATNTGITPTVPALLVMLVAGSNNTTSRSVSGYAIVTTNPTWTEQYDDFVQPASSSERITLAMATGARTALTATGNATASFSGTESGYHLAIIGLAPYVNKPTAIELLTAVPQPIIPIGTQAIALMTVVVEPTINIIAAKWQNLTKNISNWLNQDKTP